jgi:hypothetical protein
MAEFENREDRRSIRMRLPEKTCHRMDESFFVVGCLSPIMLRLEFSERHAFAYA